MAEIWLSQEGGGSLSPRAPREGVSAKNGGYGLKGLLGGNLHQMRFMIHQMIRIGDRDILNQWRL